MFLREIWVAIVLCVLDPTRRTFKRNLSLMYRGGTIVNSSNTRNRPEVLKFILN